MTEEKFLKPGDGGIDRTSPSAKFTVLDPKKTQGRDITQIWIDALESNIRKMKEELAAETVLYDQVRSYKQETT
jgi:hypothetical protein